MITLDVHGLHVRVGGDWPEVIENVRLDFAWFELPGDGAGPADVSVKIERRSPDYDRFGNVPASFVTPRNVVYQGMEFILQRGMRDVAGKLDVAMTRAASCAAGLARAQVWRATLGRDQERNWAVLAPLLR